MIRKELLEILRCPIDQGPLSQADKHLLARLNDAIEAGQLVNRAGQRVEYLLAQGLVSQDGQRFYPIVDDIPKLLADESISLECRSTDEGISR